jgi:two-component system sensor histidine kinase DegS
MVLPEGGEEQVEGNIWEELLEKAKNEAEEINRELREINLMLEQSQVEVEKLAQRNATITMHLQQVQSQAETIPKDDMRVAYDAALEAQQRLVVMRSQVEKLQSEQNHLQRYHDLLKEVQEAAGVAPISSGSNGSGVLASAEMMIEAQEAERQRLSRQMHDGPAQALSNFILLTEIAMRLFDVDPGKAREELSNLKLAAGKTFQKVRDFIFDLHPMMLDDLGLVPTVRRYVDAFREKTGLDVSVNVTGSERRLESYIEVMVFRSVQELLTNASLHSQCNQVTVQIDVADVEIRATVEDNGKGIEVASLSEDSGLGLKLIQERVEMLGGYFEIDSAIGEGAKITFAVPAGDAPTLA